MSYDDRGMETLTLALALFTSTTEEWTTPRALFAKLDRRYHFTLDPAATADNALCSTFFTQRRARPRLGNAPRVL
jgi:hypothetical protein